MRFRELIFSLLAISYYAKIKSVPVVTKIFLVTETNEFEHHLKRKEAGENKICHISYQLTTTKFCLDTRQCEMTITHCSLADRLALDTELWPLIRCSTVPQFAPRFRIDFRRRLGPLVRTQNLQGDHHM